MPGYAERALLHGPRQRDELQQQRHVRAGWDTLRSGDSHVDSAVGAVTGFQNGCVADSDVYCLSKLNDNHTVLAAGAATGEAIGFGFDPALALRLHWWTAGAHQREDSVWGARHARAHLGPVADGPEEGNEQQQ